MYQIKILEYVKTIAFPLEHAQQGGRFFAKKECLSVHKTRVKFDTKDNIFLSAKGSAPLRRSRVAKYESLWKFTKTILPPCFKITANETKVSTGPTALIQSVIALSGILPMMRSIAGIKKRLYSNQTRFAESNDIPAENAEIIPILFFIFFANVPISIVATTVSRKK